MVADIGALIRSLPKAELHVHLEGSIRPPLAGRLAARHGVPLPQPLRMSTPRFADFMDFIRSYVALSRCLVEASDFSEAADELAEQLADSRVRYAEVTFTPMTHVARGVDPDAMAAGLVEGRARARARGVEIRWVFDVVRSFPDQAPETLALALAQRARDADSVVAIGVGGPEGPQYPADPLRLTFERAKAEGLRSVPHAGETTGVGAVVEALDVLGADRVGHGIAAGSDPAVLGRLRDEGIALEICPTSNVALGVVDALGSHPLPTLLAAGVPLSLATDDPGLFSVGLSEEYRRCAAAFGWDGAQVLAVATAAVRHAFMDETLRHELEQGQRQAYERWTHA